MTLITARYLGGLRTECTHALSGQTLQTDAPLDNHGKGEYFSPTDLLATAVGSCMLTIMGLAAEQKYQVDITGAKVSVEKIMSTKPPRKIAALNIHLDIPHHFEPGIQAGLEAAALGCPVHASLHPDIEQEVTFTWGSAAC